MDLATVFIPAAIAAVVKFVDLIQEKNYVGAAKIVVAVIVGAVAGFFGLQGLDVQTGIYAGLAASGVITVASRIGK